MTTQAVYWHEGMCLAPHHFQAADRYFARIQHRQSGWNVPYNWGVKSIDLDLDALANYRLVVRSLEARMRDGTTIAVPEDGALPVLDLRAAFQKETRPFVYLALPLYQPSRGNVAERAKADAARYVVDTQQIPDENTGQNPQSVQVRFLNLRLLTSADDPNGFETLPLARLRRADRSEAVPELDTSFIPALLAVDGWQPLLADILEPMYDRIGKKLELLSSQVVARGMSFDSHSQGDRLLLEQLRMMNEIYAPYSVQIFAPGNHPYHAYVELSRLIGKLAVFSRERKPPQLPHYEHDDLGTCFWRAKQYIDAMLDMVVEPEYRERWFVGAGLRVQVALESSWLEANQTLYIGVQSSLSPDETQRLLSSGLDMKIGSGERVDDIFRLGKAGLRFRYTNHPPRALPNTPGLIYFEVDRVSQPEEWDQVRRSLTLAIRLNENMIVSNIQGQQTLTIQVGGRTATMQFGLYVLPQEGTGFGAAGDGK